MVACVQVCNKVTGNGKSELALCDRSKWIMCASLSSCGATPGRCRGIALMFRVSDASFMHEITLPRVDLLHPIRGCIAEVFSGLCSISPPIMLTYALMWPQLQDFGICLKYSLALTDCQSSCGPSHFHHGENKASHIGPSSALAALSSMTLVLLNGSLQFEVPSDDAPPRRRNLDLARSLELFRCCRAFSRIP